MLATLILTVCLAASPSSCRQIELMADGCFAGGQAAAAQWTVENPGYVVKRIACALGRAA